MVASREAAVNPLIQPIILYSQREDAHSPSHYPFLLHPQIPTAFLMHLLYS